MRNPLMLAFLLLIPFTACRTIAPGGAANEKKALPPRLEILETQRVYAEVKDYAAFPSIIRTDREIILPFNAQDLGQLRAANIKNPHYGPAVRPLWAVSTDNAAGWRVTDQPPKLGKVLDCTFGGPLPDGGLFDLRWEYIKGTTTRPPFTLDIFKNTLARPVSSKRLPIFDRVYLHGIAALPDEGYLASAYVPGKEVVVYQSPSDAKAWREISRIRPSIPFNLSEAALAAYPDGRTVLVVRADWSREKDPEGKFKPEEGGYTWLYQADSTDLGRTWSEPRRLPVWGHPPYLLRLRSGNLLMVYGHRRAPYSVRAILSHDRGRTWDTGSMVALHTFEPGGWDIGYPVATQLDDGRILVAYYGYLTEELQFDSPHGVFCSLIRESHASEQ